MRFLILICFLPVCLRAQIPSDMPQHETAMLEEAISKYHAGFIKNDTAMVLSAIGKDFIMFNGNFSGDPAQWQAHLFLSGDNLRRWPAVFLKQAGPYENRHEFLHTSIRNNAAIVVTLETGKNKFRAWKNEKVTWLLGKSNEEWKIVGLFIKDIRNPE
jgi:hypothetical protein